ncbi:transcription elongation factor GreA [Treponema pectinovorum]|uniref:transcription elongation factor GreA n=1 Tax=Treponema pectinovorum TaxID=164 RepID=UPI0011F15C24|nr:transcription elongation factor GreA [Treponema pectinovorum]
MSAEIVTKVQEMLKEETWTRAAISNYTKNNLIELSEIVEKAKAENCADEIKSICDEQLSHSKESIIALYISGMFGLKQGKLDNSYLVGLVDIFQKNHKEPIVTYLCETILDIDPNNKFALRTLADIYRSANDPKAWEIYEKIVKSDIEEAEIAKILAEHYEAEGDLKNAIAYYKKSLLRFVNINNMTAVKEVWSKLVSLIPEEIDFFLLVQRKVEKSISQEKSALLLHDLYPYYKDNAPKDSKKWDTAIQILKIILTIDPKDSWARNEIATCFQGKHSDNAHVEEYIRASNLTQSFRNVFEAINDFEKHIAFGIRNFVYHRTWSVGIITKVENDTLTINFGKKTGVKQMSLKMAVSALQPLASDHIWVLKATKAKSDLLKIFKEPKDKSDALKIIIKSFGNSCDFKRIKAELVPSILTPGEWTSWNSAAKKALETNPIFGVNPNNINEYVVRDAKISTEEKLNNEFKAQKNFMPRVDVFMKFLNDEEADKDSEMFAEMYSYFKGFLKAFSQVNEQVVASYLVVQKVSSVIPALAFKPSFSFAELYSEIQNPREMYTLLKDTKNTTLQEDFLTAIKMLPDWTDKYIELFPTVLSKKMLKDLIDAGETEKIQKLVVKAFDNFKDYRGAVLFFFEECRNDEWFKEAGVSYQKQLITIINLIEQTYREIENHVDTTENKKLNKNAKKLIFGEKDEKNVYADFMLASDTETMTHLYTLVDDIAFLEPSYKQTLRNRILEKYPSYKFRAKEEKSLAPKGMLVTKAKLDEKKALEAKMTTVDIPEIAREVAEAKEKGDLKENAEYIAAKEAQHKLNNDLKRLQGELSRAVIFDPTTATTSMISFGTEVTLTNNNTGKDEKYVIMGPWESDPDAGIISYMSPFGNAILDSKVGEKLEFTINENKNSYTVKEIKLAK